VCVRVCVRTYVCELASTSYISKKKRYTSNKKDIYQKHEQSSPETPLFVCLPDKYKIKKNS